MKMKLLICLYLVLVCMLLLTGCESRDERNTRRARENARQTYEDVNRMRRKHDEMMDLIDRIERQQNALGVGE